MAALNAATGTRMWRSADIGGCPLSLVVTGGVVCGSVLTPPVRNVSFGLDARTGRRLWHATSPAVALAGTDAILFCLTFIIGPGPSSCTVQARHARTGTPAWKRTFPGQPALAATRGLLYLGTGDGTLRALDAATGQPVWTCRLGAPASDIATDASAEYVLDARGAIYGLQA